MEQLKDRARVTLIVSGVGNLSMAILWLGIVVLLRKTTLNLLKLLAAMISAMNLIFFVGMIYFYDGIVSEDKQTFLRDDKILIWCTCCYLVLFGTSHWMFVMKYLNLAMRMKYPNEAEF